MKLAIESRGETARLAAEQGPEPPANLALPMETSIPPRQAVPGVNPAAPVPHRHGLLQAFQSILNIVIIALFIITFTVQPFRIPSASMEPTLLVGDFLLVNKQIGAEVSPRIYPPESAIHRGDLIVFHYPVDASLHLVKRVIGLPGDRLRLRDNHVYINGSAIPEPYAVYRPAMPDSYRDDFPRLTSADPGVDSRWWIQMHSLVSQGELSIPADSYFVLGDNRNDSEDSRYWGFVPRSAIVGKPFVVYFSLNDPASTPGQSTAAAMPGNKPAPHAGPADLIDFARWDRALHIIR